jgi:pimeloyl-ACP methyl ester carboxylesterase
MIQTARELNIRVTGEGEPTLLFVHGFSCGLDDWDAQVQGLSPSFRCVALDLPGHGGSAAPQAATMAALGSAVNAAKEQSGGRRIILIGHSLGAKVIREAYSQSSACVIGLILIDGAFYDSNREILVSKAKAAIDSGGFTAYARRHFADMFLESSDPTLRERILARALELDPIFGRDLYLEAVGWDPLRGKDTLKQIAVPVLVLQATEVNSEFQRRPLQPGMSTPFMETVTSLVPRSEARIIPGSGHFPMIEAAGAVNEAIRDFATRVARS